MKNQTAAILSTFFVFFFMLGTWTIDIAMSCIYSSYEANLVLCEHGLTSFGRMTNGFWNISCVQGYHIGLYITIISVSVLAMLAINQIKEVKR